eukprot:gene1871-1012_t
MNKEKYEKTAKLIQDADCILIGAGAGMSVDIGINYNDRVDFAKRYPGMVKLGYKCNYHTIGAKDWSEEVKWGYLSSHADHMRFQLNKNDMYSSLYDLVKHKEHFVITSNVDGKFEQNGFDKSQIYTPQGDFSIIQCYNKCTPKSYFYAKDLILEMSKNVDKETQELKKPELIPKCQFCSGPTTFNLRGGNYFMDEPHEKGEKNFAKFLNSSMKKKLLILEFGAGFNTPSVIRWKMSRITYQHPNANFVRINYDHAEVEDEIVDRSIGIQDSCINTISNLKNIIISK